VVSSELVKLRTARSTIAAMTTAALLVVGVGAISAVGLVVQDPSVAGAGGPTADPLGGSLTGVNPAAYAAAALGAIAVTSEYASGTIKVSLAAVPRRAQLVIGKAIALAAVTLTVMLAAVLATFFVAQAILSTADMSLSLTAPGVARVLVGSSLYLTGVTLFAAGFGWLLRSTAGALAVLFGILAVLPVIGLLLPQPVGAAVLPYLPGNAGTAVMQLTPGGQLGPWAGLAVFSGYVLVTLAGATVALGRRDA
jgi:ABC-type transport system involved in multi-copper enzyme maturation permease subunit